MSAKLYYSPFIPAFSANGLPVAGAQLLFYLTGTTTKTTVYSDVGMVTPLANPVVADAAGRFPAIYLNDAITYRVRILDKLGAQIGADLDPYVPGQIVANLVGGIGANATTRTAITTIVPPPVGTPVVLTEAGREGTFVFSNTNMSALVTADPLQAIYIAPSSDTTGASGAWVRKFNGPLNIQWFGAVADDTGTSGTDNYAAITAALALITARAEAYDIYRLGETLYFPPGTKRGYYCSTPININATLKFKGDWAGMPNETPHGIRFPLNSAGFIVNTHQTNGYTGGAVTTTTYGGGCTFEDMCWYSGIGNQFGGGAGFNRTGNYDGILVRARVNLIRCTILGFARNNVYIAGSSDTGGSGLLGNANCTNIVDCTIRYAGRNNVYLKGTDANACHMQGGYSDYALGWGILDESAIGTNSFDNVHTELNGLGDGTTTYLGGTCAYPTTSSQRYACAVGQEAAASTTVPGTNSAVWILMQGSVGGPLWVSGMTWFAGGSLALRPVAGVSRASNFYIESGQAPVQNNNHGHMEDGMATGWNPGNTGTGETTIAPSGGPSVRVAYNPTQVAHTGKDGWVIEHNIGDGSAGGDSRIRSYRNSNMTAGHYVYERVEAADIIGTDWNTQRIWWTTGANPANLTVSRAGRSTVVPYMTMPYRLKIQAFDDANEGRLIHTGSAAPLVGAGERAQGEVVLNLAPAVGGISNWYCYTGGTPGSWGADYINARAEPTVGVGYVTGAGGAVTQATSKATGVTLNKVSGQITMNAASLAAATSVSFTLTNSAIAATDTIIVNVGSGATAASYTVDVDAVAAGSCRIHIRNVSAGALAEALVLNFAVLRAVNS
jgi:hypothetical protein